MGSQNRTRLSATRAGVVGLSRGAAGVAGSAANVPWLVPTAAVRSSTAQPAPPTTRPAVMLFIALFRIIMMGTDENPSPRHPITAGRDDLFRPLDGESRRGTGGDRQAAGRAR